MKTLLKKEGVYLKGPLRTRSRNQARWYGSWPYCYKVRIRTGEGVKVSRVTSLNKDIAYAMASADVRILAPIPKAGDRNRSANNERQIVALGDVLRLC